MGTSTAPTRTSRKPVASMIAICFLAMFAVLIVPVLLVKAPQVSYPFAILITVAAAFVIALTLVGAFVFGLWCVNRHGRK